VKWTDGAQPWLVVLVGLYLVQAVVGVDWGPLSDWQQDEAFRRWSGAALAVLVFHQLILAWRRRVAQPSSARAILKIHRTCGALCLLFLFIHTTRIGYAYLMVLGLLIPLQVTLGALPPDASSEAGRTKRTWWRRSHAMCGFLLVIGVLFHLWMVYAYK
jgi:hypothetical protein